MDSDKRFDPIYLHTHLVVRRLQTSLGRKFRTLQRKGKMSEEIRGDGHSPEKLWTPEMDSRMAACVTPLILHCDLQRTTFTDYLGTGFKIRVSRATPRDTVILPRCGIAVLLIHLARISASSSSSSSSSDVGESGVGKESLHQLIDRIRAFVQGHRVGIVVVVGAVFGAEEVGGVIAAIQRHFLPRPPLILPAHGDAQAAAHIQILAKATQTEMRRVVQSRIDGLLGAAVAKDVGVALARAIGLSHHQASVLLDSFGSLGAVASASAVDLHQRTPLDAATAASIAAFFAKDTVTL